MIDCVGIDFDNTIACYESVFPEVAVSLGMVASDWHGSKMQLRDHVRGLPDGETSWQRIQGRAYGRYMHQARLFPGVAEFLIRCRTRGLHVNIVSHKTRVGHFDPEQIPLRDAALDWMQQQGFFSENRFGLRIGDVFFADTREEKLRIIQELKCGVFIDDLIEVLTEHEFPGSTRRILYSPDHVSGLPEEIEICTSWMEISKSVFGPCTEPEILEILNQRAPELRVRSVSLHKGRGNSQIFKLIDEEGQRYALKCYPDLQHDQRARREVEFAALALCREAGLSVPRPVATDADLNWGIYEWIDAGCVTDMTGDFVETVLSLIAGLRDRSAELRDRWTRPASQACFSGEELERQILRRIADLEPIDHPLLREFLERELQPATTELIRRSRALWPGDYQTSLPPERQTLSPSDFGSHNAITKPDGSIVFIDLEYFGWDDPAKLIADFVWHPGMTLDAKLRNRWLDGTRRIFGADPDLEARLKLAMPLYGIRWCLILLNEFRRSEWMKRLHADVERSEVREEILMRQLAKSRQMLERVRSINEWTE